MTLTDLLAKIASLLTLAVVLSARVKIPAAPVPPMRSVGRIAVLVGMAVTTASSSLVIAHGPEVLRMPVAIVAVLLAPGYAVVVFRHLADALDELVLALAVSFALLVLVGTTMAGMRLWDPLLVVSLSTLVTAPALAWHSAYLFFHPVAETTPTATS